ncbi:MAG: AI-2E family transporter [Actinobacteria bacterium]|nr:AI-2E family transporter [Actinomycetota bacterium]
MEERIRVAGRLAWWLVGITAAATIVGFVVWFFRVIIPPLVLASVIVFLLNPVVTRLQRRGVPRLAGTAASYLGVALLLTVIGLALSPLVQNQAEELSDRWPKVRRQIERNIDDLSKRSERGNWPIRIPRVKQLENQGAGNDKKFSDQVATLRDIAGRVLRIGLIFLLGPIVAFYLLMDLPDIRRRIESLIPDRSKDEVLFLAHRMNLVLGGFFRGQLAVAFVVGSMVSAGLLALRLPLWLIVGMIAGLFNMIPLIGPYIGAVPGIVIALTTRDAKAALGVILVMVVAQQIDNHFITPLVMRRAVQLHPAAVMMALLAFGTVGGFFGLLLAVPVTAVAKVVGGHLWRKYVLGVSLPGLDHPDGQPPSELGGEPATAPA